MSWCMWKRADGANLPVRYAALGQAAGSLQASLRKHVLGFTLPGGWCLIIGECRLVSGNWQLSKLGRQPSVYYTIDSQVRTNCSMRQKKAEPESKLRSLSHKYRARTRTQTLWIYIRITVDPHCDYGKCVRQITVKRMCLGGSYELEAQRFTSRLHEGFAPHLHPSTSIIKVI